MPTVKPTIQIGDEVRPMTDEEFAQWETDNAQAETKTETKAILKETVLAKLGLTADEVAALLS